MIKFYQKITGCLIWPANQWRMDICFAVHSLAQYVSNPSIEHVDAMIDILRYCIGTTTKGMCYRQPHVDIPNPLKFDVLCRTDADHSNDYDSKSVMGYILSVHFPKEIDNALETNQWPVYNSIGFRSKKQSFVVLSPHEAEMGAVCESTKVVIWFRNFLRELNLLNTTRPSHILSDSSSTILAMNEQRSSSATRHYARHYNFTKAQVRQNEIRVMKIKTSDNHSDCLTKFKSITDLNKDADSFMSNAEVSTSNSNKKSSIKKS